MNLPGNADKREDIVGMQQSLLDLQTEITEVAASSVLDHHQVDWSRVRRCRYLIHQRLHYDYSTPIYDLSQRLMILPPEHYGNQHRLSSQLEVSLPGHTRATKIDAFGNTEMSIFVPEVEHAISFEAWIQVERCNEDETHELSAGWLSDPRLLEASALTRPDAALRQVAEEMLATGKEGLALAQALNNLVYQHMHYAHDETTIHTTAAEVLALGRGVCQDYAHLMLALCRLCKLPARYVSGHMLGEGGTHAWVEVLVPVDGAPERAIAVPFDPTHGRQANLSYLTISVGRDYYDVAPTSGTFRAACRGELSTHKQVDLTLLEYTSATENREQL